MDIPEKKSYAELPVELAVKHHPNYGTSEVEANQWEKNDTPFVSQRREESQDRPTTSDDDHGSSSTKCDVNEFRWK